MNKLEKTLVFAIITLLSTSLPALTQAEQNELNKQLYKEVSARHTPSNDHVIRVQELIKQGADVNFHNPDQNNQTPLHAAAYQENVAGVKTLLENGAQAAAYDNAKTTPLHFSIDDKTFGVAELLLRDKNVNVNDSSPGFTPLYAAIMSGPEIVRFLIEHGANPEIAASNGETPLTFAKALYHFWKPMALASNPEEAAEFEKDFVTMSSLLRNKV